MKMTIRISQTRVTKKKHIYERIYCSLKRNIDLQPKNVFAYTRVGRCVCVKTLYLSLMSFYLILFSSSKRNRESLSHAFGVQLKKVKERLLL